MNKTLIVFLALILPSASGEMAHNPQDVSQGTTLTAWIDVDDDVKSITFYVCTLKDPYTCYKPQKMTKNESQNNTEYYRFQFEYEVKENDYPGYKYEIEKEDNSTEKIPASEYSHYEGMDVEKMGDSYYFKVSVKATESSSDTGLPNLSFMSTITIISLIVIAGRK